MIIIDYKDKRPIYEQIAEKFQHLILSGVLEPDSKMPSVRSLAVDLAINPNTIQRAYGELERSGFIYAVKGRGNFVCNNGDLAKKERENVMDELLTQINKCKQMGISKEEIEQAVAALYEEESHDRD